MCGIAGTINMGDTGTLALMNDLQHHRGPDDSGIWKNVTQRGDCVSLASKRLAILDLTEAGHMPMTTQNGKYTVVFNGEIYNHLKLRKMLSGRDICFKSHSDTETILYMYQEFGPQSVKMLNGMFALALWDHEKQELFLARDHFGIKPLYYFWRGNKFAFASEVKSFKALREFSAEINPQALNQYFTFLWVPDPLTIFKDVYKLPAGHMAFVKNGQMRIEQFWDLKFPPESQSFIKDEAELKTELKKRIYETVRSQMLSDVPLGAFLSAGLDSSSIVAAMCQYSSEPVRTFTITFPERYQDGDYRLDDKDVARRTAEYFGCRHTEIMVEPDVVNLLPKLVYHMDEPTADPAIIAAYLVNREARKDVTVLLSGIGGDELFAGYRKYYAHYLAQTYNRNIPSFLHSSIIKPLVSNLPTLRGTKLKGYIRLMQKMVSTSSLPPVDRFISQGYYTTPDLREELFLEELNSLVAGYDPAVKHRRYFDKVKGANFLNQMLYVDIKTFMESLNLNYNDKMSMASSVEVRVPFLDWELAEWVAASIPPTLKIKGGTTKYILREAMRDVLPPEVLQQRKAGFFAPIDYWLTNDLREMVDDLLSGQRVRMRGLFNYDVIKRLYCEHTAGKKDWSFQIWLLLNFELWMQKFIDE